ncbi:unnamed protein product [Rhizoctonia solani]|nr:unnamed protein product [Rhizoctonia solani]
MRARKQTTVRYSKIVIPCPKCGHGCEISLGEAETSGSSTESDTEANPPAKKVKLAVETSRSESSDDSGSNSGSDAPVATNSRAESSSSDSSDSDSDSGSESESDAPVPQAPVAVAQEPATRNSRVSPSSSESSDSLDSDSDVPIPEVALTKPQKPVNFKPPAPSTSSSDSDDESDSDGSDSDSSDSGGPRLPKPLERSSVKQFFSRFPTFQYDSSQPVMTEYLRMSQTTGFKSLGPEAQKKARRDLKDALAKDFGQLYGYDVDDIGAWQSLCRVLRFEDVPDDLEGCQDLVTATYVNIIDLIDTVSTGAPVQHFDSEKELSEYTIKTKNILSRDSPHAGSLLKFLLRNIYRPTDATRVNPEPLYGLNRKRKRKNMILFSSYRALL